MQRDALLERFFTALISGNRPATRQIIDELLQAGAPAERILSLMIWPTLEQIQNLHRGDQLSDLAHHFATRLLRSLVDQLQMRLAQAPRNNRTVLVVSGAEDSEELAAQMGADLLEARGFTVHYAGGGIANDEIVAQLGQTSADVLVVFAAIPATVPQTRLLIDHLHDIGVCPKMQIAVGGGVFNRADGLAEEIGADLWANTPEELAQTMSNEPERRMDHHHRTVGRKRRMKKEAA